MTDILDPVLGITQADVDAFEAKRKLRGKRDSRVCVCGHAAGAHFPVGGFGGPADIAEHEAGTIACQAGKTPCACNRFVYALTASDVRSFIQKTEGPGPDHALSKGIKSSIRRGVKIEWRDGIVCMICHRPPSEVGTLIPIAYNERHGEAFRSTPVNRMHCQSCREEVQRQVATASESEAQNVSTQEN